MSIRGSILLVVFAGVTLAATDKSAPRRLVGQDIRLAQALPGPPLAAPPGVPRRTGRVVGLTPETESFLKKLVSTYQQARSYQDRGRMKVVQQSGRVTTTVEMPMELAFERPNRLLLDAGQHLVACDGTNLHLVMPASQQYTLRRAPDKLEKRHVVAGSALGGADEGHPELIDFLIQPDAYERLVSQMTKVSWRPEAVVEGVRCRVLAYETVSGTALTNYIDPQRMLLLKVEAESRANTSGVIAPGSLVAVPPQPATRLLYEMGRVTLNSDLSAAMFAYQPGPGLRRTDQRGPGGKEPHAGFGETREGGHLVGKPAPRIDLNDLEGRAFTADELRGKVALLFFWSVNCGEHCLASITKVQAIADHFKGRTNVLVLGITNDSDKPDIVRQLMARKQAVFRTLLDEEMRLQIQLQLGGQPTFLVLGPDGVVRWTKLGAPPTIQTDLVAQMERLLAGDSPK